jgi:hypothetical protein
MQGLYVRNKTQTQNSSRHGIYAPAETRKQVSSFVVKEETESLRSHGHCEYQILVRLKVQYLWPINGKLFQINYFHRKYLVLHIANL